jgi:hypothetical protein
MSNPRRPSTISSTCRFFAPLALVMLLVGAPASNAQDTVNGANSNNGNQNVNANRNANAGTNNNANNSNANNTDGNRNANANANQSPTPNPTPDPGIEGRRAKLIDGYWYFLIVTGMFVVILLPFAYTITRAISSSGEPTGPLGLPDGSVRAILAYTLVTFLGFYILASVLSFSEFKPPEFLLGIVATVIGFYFGSRTNEGRGAPAQTGVVGGTVKDSAGTATQDATVELTQEDGKKLTAKTDKAGKFEIKNVPAGEHSIQASKDEHQSDQTKVTVKAGETQAVNLTLK